MSNQDEMIQRIAAANFGEGRNREICEQAIRKALREIPASQPHGFILRGEHVGYEDMRSPGKISISMQRHEAVIDVANFDFADAYSCRQSVTKAMCWARDVLNAAIENNRIVPGGAIVSVDASG